MRSVVFQIAIVLVLVIPAGTTFAQSEIQVLENEVISQFPDGIRFHLSIKSEVDIETIDLVYGTNGRSCQSSTARQPMGFETDADVKVDWNWDWLRRGILPPGAEVWWQWEIVDVSGKTFTSPKETFIVQDQRHEWKSITRNGVTLQWYSGGDSFGSELHDIATNSLDLIESDMGLKLSEGIYITVYPTSAEVREALLVSTEWTGGVAFTDYNSMIIGVGPNELDWAGQILPHEINHLVVGALTFNCKGVWLPAWLSEGLAELSEGPLSQRQIDLVLAELENDNLLSLASLTGQFSAYGDRAQLSYLQSKLVVNFLIEEYGADNLADLLASVQAGDNINLALEKVYGFDTQGLDAAWRAFLGFDVTMDDRVSEPVRTTPTLIPTLPPLAPPVQPSVTSSPAIMVKAITPTNIPTLALRTPTSKQPALTPGASDLLETPPQAVSRPSAGIVILSTIFGLSLTSVVILYFLYGRKK
jgi:hypothetical protein